MVNSPLPNSESSLSKYITLEAHYSVLKQIEHDTTLEALRSTFDPDHIATARKRYFLERDGFIRRDKLIELIQEEGAFTDRVKMAMYFLFMLRDSRYRTFICSQVADPSGRWNPAAFLSESQEIFEGAGGRKAFTNLRQTLVHAELLNADFSVRSFPELSLWFSPAVEIAGQHIGSLVERQQFLDAPQTVLIRYGILGLLNTTAEQLVRVDGPILSEEAADYLPAYDTGFGQISSLSSPKLWQKIAPEKRIALTRAAILSNPALLERANLQHYELEKLMVDECAHSVLEASQTAYIDLLVRAPKYSILFEMKSCSENSLRSQVRRGISQLLEYSFLYRKELPNQTCCLVLERKPSNKNAWMIEYVESVGISIVWRGDEHSVFRCLKASRDRLAPLLPAALLWR